MKFSEIKELMKEFDSSNLSQLEVADGEFSIKMKKGGEYVPIPMPVTPVPVQKDAANSTPFAPSTDLKPQEKLQGTLVKAPLVGVFYQSSAPGAEPYVKEGQKVKKGDIVCLIEAMKMINEITSPVSGVVKKILVENEELVSFDQIIMEIEE